MYRVFEFFLMNNFFLVSHSSTHEVSGNENKLGYIWFFARFALTFRFARSYLHSEKLKYIWLFSHLFVTLQA